MKITPKLSMTYTPSNGICYLNYEKSIFKIGLEELRGLRYSDLVKLDPDTNTQHQAILRVCEIATEIRLALETNIGGEFPIPAPVNLNNVVKGAFTKLNQLIS